MNKEKKKRPDYIVIYKPLNIWQKIKMLFNKQYLLEVINLKGNRKKLVDLS